MNRFTLNFPAIFILLWIASCTDITEHDINYGACLWKLEPVTMTIEKTVPDIPGASCLMISPGRVFVVSNKGVIQSYDAANLELIDEVVVGDPSPSGYTKMVLRPGGQSAFLIGAHGRMPELSIPDLSVIEEFSICSTPADIAVTTGIPGYLWVVNGLDNTVEQVDMDLKQSLYTVNVPEFFEIKCIEPSQVFDDSLLIGTSNLMYRLGALDPGLIRLTYIQQSLYFSWVALCAIPFDSNYVAVMDSEQGALIGEFCAYTEMEGSQTFDEMFFNTSSMEGDFWRLSSGNDYANVYSLGYAGDGFSRLYRYSYVQPNGIRGHVDLDGFPVDVKVSESGNIYLLTVDSV